MQYPLFIFGLLLTLFSSCAINRNNTHYQVFFVGEEGNQYFIKPAEFNGIEHNVEVDFVFRYKDEITDSVTCNFSYYSEAGVEKSIYSMQILDSTQSILSSEPELLFVETEKRGFESRYTCKFSLADFASMTKEPNWHVLIQTSETSEPQLFYPDRYSKVMQKKLAENIMVLL